MEERTEYTRTTDSPFLLEKREETKLILDDIIKALSTQAGANRG